MKVEFKRIDHVQLVIPKGAENKARDFYSGMLGLEEIEKPDSLKSTGGVWLKIAGVELHLGIDPSQTYSGGMLFQTGASDFKKDSDSFKKEHPAFVIENLEEVKKYLNQSGVWIKEEVPIPGRKRFSFFDPFGNRIELVEFD